MRSDRVSVLRDGVMLETGVEPLHLSRTEVGPVRTLSATISLRPRAILSLLVVPVCLAVSGCNSIDALTPPENVGDGGYRSSPVNQADLDTMSAQPPVIESAGSDMRRTMRNDMPVEHSASLPDATVQPDVASTAYARADETYRNPAGTFEAQARALTTNPPPQIASAADSGEQTTVGYPASGKDVRKTAAAVAEQQSARADTEADVPAQAGTEEPTTPSQEAAIDPTAAGPAGSIRFLPIMGAPVEAIRPLSEQLGAEARSHGLAIKTAADPGSQHILKGYFSAFKDGKKTTIVYVWDVLDQAGNRLHRIQGQDSVETKGADLWSGVPPQTMRDIATKSVGQYLSWRDGKAG